MRTISQGRPARAPRETALAFVAVTFFALVAGGPAPAADKGHGKTDAAALIGEMLAKGKAPEPSAAKRQAARLQGDDRLRYLAVAEELRGESAWRRQNLPPLLENRREKATALSELTCLLATAYAHERDFAAAERCLNLIAGQDPLTQADVASARARIAIGRGEPDAAKRETATGWNLLNRPQETSSEGMETAKWRRKLIERRLSAAGAEASQATALRDGGPAYAAWLKADTLKRPELYEGVIKDYPDTVFATAAALERAMQLLDAGKLAEAGALLRKKAKAECLAAARETMRGDVALCGGELKEAAKAYKAALASLSAPAPAPKEIDTGLQKLLTPEQPLHRWDEWHNNTWHARPAGKIMIPASSPESLAWWRYGVLLRQSVVLYLQGDKEAAALTAMTVNGFDPLDREMDARQSGSAGVLLKQLYQQDMSATVPLEFIDHVPMSLKTQLLAGLVFFHAYNHRESYHWFTRALNNPQLKGLARDGALLGAGWAAYLTPGGTPKATALFEQVKHMAGHKTNEIWYLSQSLLAEAIANDASADEFPKAVERETAILTNVYKKLGKRNEYAFWACHTIAVCNSIVNPEIARKHYLELLTFDKSVLTDQLKEMVKDSLQELDANQQQ